MGATPEELKAQIDQTRGELSADIDTLADRVSPASIARRRTAAVRESASSLRTAVMGRASAASDSAGAVPGVLSDRAQGNPMAAGVIAFGLGLLVSSLLPTTAAEEQLGTAVKAAADDLAEPLKQIAQEQLDEAKDALVPAAQDAAEHVKETATDAAQTTAGHAEQAAAATKDDATDAAQTVREERQ